MVGRFQTPRQARRQPGAHRVRAHPRGRRHQDRRVGHHDQGPGPAGRRPTVVADHRRLPGQGLGKPAQGPAEHWLVAPPRFALLERVTHQEWARRSDPAGLFCTLPSSSDLIRGSSAGARSSTAMSRRRKTRSSGQARG
uniref:RES domain-containing protein n=1 Tax=Parastrongyloides trichosuri TaxID=131310 RepID=A0A0N5A605_PARTI